MDPGWASGPGSTATRSAPTSSTSTTGSSRRPASSTTDALRHHAELEYGITIGDDRATPIGTAVLAGLAFMVGAGLPLLVSVLAPAAWRVPLTVVAVVAALGGTATVVARLGGLRVGRTVLRTVVIGLLTMLLTLAGGSLFVL